MEELEKNKNEILTLYNAIPKESEDNMKHYVDLRDIKIESREDLVKTCQVFRNPRFETFRFIYMRGIIHIDKYQYDRSKHMGTFIQNEILAMHWLNRLVASLLTMLGINVESRLGGSLQFFIYDVIM